MTSSRALLFAVFGAALFAVALPTSVGGAIARSLSIVSLLGTSAFLAAIVVLAPGRVSAAGLVAAAGILGLLLLFTIASPFTALSLGVIFIYLALALLYLVNLRGVGAPGIDTAFTALTIAALLVGYAIAFDVTAVDAVLVRWYGAFYPELLTNMVVLNDKPVLTFATHSMAGFMIYLLFYVQWLAWRQRRGWWRAAAALGYIGLLFALTSTTGWAFGAVAVGQMAITGLGVVRRYSVALAVMALLAALAAGAASGVDVAAWAERAEAAVVGDRIRGLFARYAAGGLLASSMTYLSESPLAPIGFSATESLYLGDSGIVVNLLRGSLPLLVAVYGGLWAFLRINLHARRSAWWLWICIVAFEVGFTPLQYFRFVGFAPFLVLCVNAYTAPDAEAVSRASGSPTAAL